MDRSTRVTIVTSDIRLASHISLRLHSKGYQAACLSCADSVLGVFYSDPPDLLIVDLTSHTNVGVNIISTLRGDSFFSAIPIIGLVADFDFDSFQWDGCPLDDFLHLPINFNELFGRISLSQARIKRIFDNNPLTRLPGNTSIQRAIEDAMGKPLMVCYLDINHFKPYNDVYGFAHGDEVLRMTARIMFNAVHDSGGGFCGHIGGDDFVFIIESERAESVCQTIMCHFDTIVQDMFDEDTKKRGYYSGINRKGEEEHIPLLSVALAAIPMNVSKLRHVAKVAEVAADLKKMAKSMDGSRFVVDKRSA